MDTRRINMLPFVPFEKPTWSATSVSGTCLCIKTCNSCYWTVNDSSIFQIPAASDDCRHRFMGCMRHITWEIQRSWSWLFILIFHFDLNDAAVTFRHLYMWQNTTNFGQKTFFLDSDARHYYYANSQQITACSSRRLAVKDFFHPSNHDIPNIKWTWDQFCAHLSALTRSQCLVLMDDS